MQMLATVETHCLGVENRINGRVWLDRVESQATFLGSDKDVTGLISKNRLKAG